jgi:TonB family protein
MLLKKLWVGVLLLSGAAFPQSKPVVSSEISEFAVGRYEPAGSGGSTDAYEIYVLREEADRTAVRRVTITPPTGCLSPVTVEYAEGSAQKRVRELLESHNPCALSEKEMRAELRHCKQCPVFSGGNVLMHAQCGEVPRTMRAEILDRELFDADPIGARRTWTMQFLQGLDLTVGPNGMDKPENSSSAKTALLADVASGKYDNLFFNTPERPSNLAKQTGKPVSWPQVEIAEVEPLQPEKSKLPEYPLRARAASVEGTVVAHASVDQQGTVTAVSIESGHQLLRTSVQQALSQWKFPATLGQQDVEIKVAFKTQCTSE